MESTRAEVKPNDVRQPILEQHLIRGAKEMKGDVKGWCIMSL